MKSFLSLLLLLSMMAAGVQAQQIKPDSTTAIAYYQPAVVVDSLPKQHPLQIENALLRQQNERLMSKESRFWAVVVIGIVAAIAKAAAN